MICQRFGAAVTAQCLECCCLSRSSSSTVLCLHTNDIFFGWYQHSRPKASPLIAGQTRSPLCWGCSGLMQWGSGSCGLHIEAQRRNSWGQAHTAHVMGQLWDAPQQSAAFSPYKRGGGCPMWAQIVPQSSSRCAPLRSLSYPIVCGSILWRAAGSLHHTIFVSLQEWEVPQLQFRAHWGWSTVC